MHPVESGPVAHHGETGLTERELIHDDERFVLIVGFCVGMMVAATFLVYVVLSAAKLLV